jgi:hypothetical protein
LLLQRDEGYEYGQSDLAPMRAKRNVQVVATAKQPAPQLSFGVRWGGIALRTLFILVLTLITARVASPQNENIWSILETPGDFIRVVLGVILCGWFALQVFMLPKDAAAYRIWIYLGLALLPLSLLCAVVIW